MPPKGDNALAFCSRLLCSRLSFSDTRAQLDRSEEAIPIFRQIVDTYDQDVQPRMSLAIAQSRMGDSGGAVETLKAALALNPQERHLLPILEHLVAMLELRVRPSLPFQTATRGVSTPLSSVFLMRTDDKLLCHSPNIDCSPPHPPPFPYRLLALLFHPQGLLEESLPYSAQLLQTAGVGRSAWLKHGQVLLRLGRPREGLPFLEKAWRWGGSGSRDFETANALGDAHYALGEVGPARICYPATLPLCYWIRPLRRCAAPVFSLRLAIPHFWCYDYFSCSFGLVLCTSWWLPAC